MSSRKRRAPRVTGVFAGINAYPDPEARLYGCVNDAYDWAELFAPAIRASGGSSLLILDAAATLNVLRSRLDDLVGALAPGDLGIFQFSGHGTWIPDRNGDEADGRDECLVCYDYALGGLLVDDQVSTILRKLRPGARLLYVTDSCHSGTVLRFMPPTGGETVRSLPRFLPPTAVMLKAADERTLQLAGRSPRRREAAVPGVVHLSGCRDMEYSYDSEFRGRPNGAMTRAAVDAWKSLRTPVTPDRWYAAVRKRLPSASAPQTPQLNVSADLRKRPLLP